MHRRRKWVGRGLPCLPCLACLLAALGVAPAQVTETVLHSFVSPPAGASSTAGVVADSAGNLYGTASSGGTGDQGVVFKLTPSGNLTVLHNFSGGIDGGTPYGGVILDSAGNLYGSASIGGTYGGGVVYKISASGGQSILYNFTGSADGGTPYATLIRDTSGNFYGTTQTGGTGFAGVVFKLTPSGVETVLYNFTGGTDGGYPQAGVVRDTAGNLYGTAYQGGAKGAGAVYMVSAGGTETVLYNFQDGADGGYPTAGVTRDTSGNLYGTTPYGGDGNFGVVYKVNTSGAETVLYTFTGGADGGQPLAGLIRETSGTMYGTASVGGTANAGVVFALSAGNKETVLHNFAGGTDGATPQSGLLRNSSGTLFGTTFAGDSGNLGVVYQVTAAGAETVLYSFKSNGDGRLPVAGLVEDPAGNLYGTSSSGGSGNAGVVFELSAAGQETILYNFTGGADGRTPFGGVVLDSSGNLYGTASAGGTAGAGVVFMVTPAGKETVLYSFKGGTTDGSYPSSGVVRDSSGNLYGVTAYGGSSNGGTVFKVTAAGQETVLHNFTGGTDGLFPYAGVILDSSGNLYGTTYYGGPGNDGTVYKVASGGKETIVYTFNGFAENGLFPIGDLARDSAGNLYGTTYLGGNGPLGSGGGVVFKISPAGKETVLYSFTDGADGGYPYGGVTRDSSGNLYGTTTLGGTDNWGVVFKIDTSGQETVLYSFTDAADGGYPYSHALMDSSGNLYATTYYGGSKRGGVVFKLAGAAAGGSPPTAKP
jgi:uncharacterized repeat protein (TIGR03803 family)